MALDRKGLRLALFERLQQKLAGTIKTFLLVDSGGVTIPAGASVLACLAAANHDPASVAEPERLDLTRAPNPHLTFGLGPHACPGANLARVVITEAIGMLVNRYPNATLAVPEDRLRWRPGLRNRGLRELPVLLTAASSG